MFMSSTGPFPICLYEDKSVSVEFDNTTKDFSKQISMQLLSICLKGITVLECNTFSMPLTRYAWRLVHAIMRENLCWHQFDSITWLKSLFSL
jgi:hypothetical protein